jgi:hypothetical protein
VRAYVAAVVDVEVLPLAGRGTVGDQPARRLVRGMMRVELRTRADVKSNDGGNVTSAQRYLPWADWNVALPLEVRMVHVSHSLQSDLSATTLPDGSAQRNLPWCDLRCTLLSAKGEVIGVSLLHPMGRH